MESAKKITLQNLSLEVTRRCNLMCGHCMKGQCRNEDMSDKVIDDTFKQIDTIGRLFLTGGEPTLAYGVLESIIQAVKKYNVRVMEWGMDTNGTMYDPKFYKLLTELENICRKLGRNSNEMKGTICISTDEYHTQAIKQNKTLTRVKYLKSIKQTERLPWFIGYRGLPNELFNEGRAKDIHNKTKIKMIPRHYSLLEGERHCLIGMGVFVNCDGIVSHCDCSYEKQDAEFNYGNVSEKSILDIVKATKDLVICNSLDEFYEDIEKEENRYQTQCVYEDCEEAEQNR